MDIKDQLKDIPIDRVAERLGLGLLCGINGRMRPPRLNDKG